LDIFDLKNNDLVSYFAFREDGTEILVTSDVEAVSKIVIDNDLEKFIGGVAYEDSVNTCPRCAKLFYIEELIQLENDIVCEACVTDEDVVAN